MKTNTLDILLARYGPTMMVRELAAVLRVSPKTVYARRTDNGGDFDIPSTKKNGRRLFQTADVANYLDNRG